MREHFHSNNNYLIFNLNKSAIKLYTKTNLGKRIDAQEP